MGSNFPQEVVRSHLCDAGDSFSPEHGPTGHCRWHAADRSHHGYQDTEGRKANLVGVNEQVPHTTGFATWPLPLLTTMAASMVSRFTQQG